MVGTFLERKKTFPREKLLIIEGRAKNLINSLNQIKRLSYRAVGLRKFTAFLFPQNTFSNILPNTERGSST